MQVKSLSIPRSQVPSHQDASLRQVSKFLSTPCGQKLYGEQCSFNKKELQMCMHNDQRVWEMDLSKNCFAMSSGRQFSFELSTHLDGLEGTRARSFYERKHGMSIQYKLPTDFFLGSRLTSYFLLHPHYIYTWRDS